MAAGAAEARLAAAPDAAAVGRLLHRFNTEYDEPAPAPEWIGERACELIAAGATEVLLAGGGPDGILVVRYQPSIWSDGDEAYIAELYVVPEARRRGLGSALMEAALARCRERRCDHVFLGTDEGDADAHRLYERFGFSNRTGAELTYVYEREL
ncbi:MAG: GNAT family N-acetyltransferase [Acidobacteria bacterium]|nr:MAG: GNAT family N-acetyltransferase [Acidobacteriota bacterium]GIK76901.1 MAG: hypothetical protein BroJett022_05910 [Actinomycetes bacterium]